MDKVTVQIKTVTIPTYEPDDACEHPMFFENRVYQGISGKVYPNSVIERVSDEKKDRKYKAIFLENKYLLVVILPEIGGKIQRIYDKTNDYDAVYYNDVVKPALVGLTGPWTAGGVGFNWPVHHRPSIFEEMECRVEENDDGSVTVWCGEIENMYHIKGMSGVTLYPEKAYVEVTGHLYNPAEIPQTFLWWVNPAVVANDTSKSIFPPDVHTVMDHVKLDISKFPVSMSTYAKSDYSDGVDISYYRNIPVPTAYMAMGSKYDFIGNYDFERQAGVLHIADHHVSPGKKQWTWGSGNFGRAWDRNLSDDGRPYAEIMAGVFSENQPDFSYLMPYEEKKFKQYFVPYKGIGEVKNATTEAVVNLEVDGKKAHIMIYAPSQLKLTVLLTGTAVVSYIRETVEMSPSDIFDRWIDLDDEETETGIRLILRNSDGDEILHYVPEKEFHGKMPEPAKAVKPAKEISSMEELYLTAVHLEQYRHATRRPEEYYLEGLKRDKEDIRLNNGYGKLLYKKGLFEEAEKRFRTAIKRATSLNPNPYDCEPYYNLGLALKMQGRYDEAYDAFFKSVWDGNIKSKGFYQLACVSAKMNKYDKALEFVNQSLINGAHNMRARTLKCALLRREGRIEEAVEFARESISIDPLDFGGRYELFIMKNTDENREAFIRLMRDDLQNYIELSLCYAEADLCNDAANLLALISDKGDALLHYYRAYYSKSDVELEIAQKSDTGFAFPNRLQEIFVFGYAIEHNPDDWFSRYCLGNLYYDKGVWFKAIKCWNDALAISPRNSRVLRNLAIANYNKLKDKDEALRLMERAAIFAPNDVRIYYELDLIRKLTNYPIKKRLKDMADKMEMVEARDDLFTEYITLLNSNGYYEYALKAIKRHIFHPWEGGEGKITLQYRLAHMGCARNCIKNRDYEEAINHLHEALVYPRNLGEGKLEYIMDNDIYYLLGCAYENTDKITSIEYFKKATQGTFSLEAPIYYDDCPPQMYYYRTLAYEKLGDTKKAAGGFNTLINYYEEHIEDKPEIDYFAVSLTSALLFECDLQRDNYAHCCYLAALGFKGKGMMDKCEELIEMGLSKNCSHQGLLLLKNADMNISDDEKDDKTTLRTAKWNVTI